MTTTDLIALFVAIFTAGGVTLGVMTWTSDRRYKNQEKLEAIRQESAEKIELLKKQLTDNSIEKLTTLISDLAKRVADWERLQTIQAKATIERFHALELSMQVFTKEVGSLHESTRQQARAIVSIWKTVVKEIAPGVMRISDKKNEDDK